MVFSFSDEENWVRNKQPFQVHTTSNIRGEYRTEMFYSIYLGQCLEDTIDITGYFIFQ